MPRPNVQALRKPNIERYGNNSPTPYAWRPLRQLLSIFVFEVSQASHIQEEDITPLFYQRCIWTRLPQSKCKDNTILLKNPR